MSFGAVLKPSYDLKLDHSRLGIDFQGGIPQVVLDQELRAELEFPWIFGIGGVWEFHPDRWKGSIDVTWTDWSNYRFRESGQESNPLNANTSKRPDDTITLRLGTELLLDLGDIRIPLRSGIGYDPTPTIGGNDRFFTVSVGSGLQFPADAPRFQCDLAYEFRWGNNVNETALVGFDAANPGQDIRRHRVLLSLIYYF